MRRDLGDDGPVTHMSADDPLWRHPVVVRLAHAGRRLLRVDRRHPWLLDAGLIVGLLLVIGVPDVLRAARFGPSVPLVLVLQPSLALPLLWRRRAATPVFAVVVVVVLVQWSLGVWLHTDIALFVALYSVARHSPPHHLPWAAGGAFAALLVAALRVPVQVSPVVVLFFLSSAATAAAALGLALRVGRAYLVALRERATRLEIEQEQRSRLAVASERARITREMHDIIGHNLSVIIGLADGGSYAAEVRPERGGEALRLIAATGRQALGELRGSSACCGRTSPLRRLSARSRASPTSTRCPSASAPPGRGSSTAPRATSTRWTEGSS